MLRQCTTFRLNDNLYGIDVLLVREINRHVAVTEVSPAPDFVRGLINLRGQIVTLIDPGVRLSMGRRPSLDTSCSIVLKSKDETERMVREGLLKSETPKDTVGLIVDAIGDMVSFEDQQVEPPPPNIHGIDAAFIDGLVKLDEELLVLLKVQQLLSTENK